MSDLNRRRTQLVAAVGNGTEPTWATIEVAANAAFEIEDLEVTPGIGRVRRNPLRRQIGQLKSIPTTKMQTITFKTPIRGSGTAGVAPKLGLLLRGCAHTEVINTGTASITQPVRDASNQTGTDLQPTTTGTFTGTKSGEYRLIITGSVLNTSVDINWTFISGDGTQNRDGAISTVVAAPSVIEAGLSVDVNDILDIDVDNDGDTYVFQATSDQQVDTVYTPEDDDSLHIVLDIAVLEDGRVRRMYASRGNVEQTCSLEDGNFYDFTFQGILADDDDTAILTGIAFETTVPPAFVGVTQIDMLGGLDASQCFESIDMAMNATVVPVKCASSTTGIKKVRVSSNAPTITAAFTATTNANLDLHALITSSTVFAFDFQVGTVSGNIMLFESANAQLTERSESENEDILQDDLEMDLTQPDFDAGGDYAPYTITFK